MRSLFLVLAFFLAAAVPAAAMATSSCESCHGALDRRNADPVLQWKTDIHREAGLGCPDCHGGDPGKVATAMSSASGFLGIPDPLAAVKLCGGCHSDPGRMPDPTASTDQMAQFMSGSHRLIRDGGGPTCTTCHGSHGVARVTDPSTPVFRTSLAELCLRCHLSGADNSPTGAWLYMEDVHGSALAGARNIMAPTCADCHGAHRADVLSPVGILMVCGNCHQKEYEYFQAGPHGEALLVKGTPSCTDCHGHHGIKAAGLQELIGRVTDNCGQCHQIGNTAWQIGGKIDESLGVAVSFLASLEQMSTTFRLTGVETGKLDRLSHEAYGWLQQVESAIHSVNTDWEELTGMAKVKMMSAWDVSRNYSLEKGLRRVILLLIAMLAAFLFALLAYKLHLTEKDQQRRQLLGSPEARQREQEHHRK